METEPGAQNQTPTKPSTWLDLVLYLVVGIGLLFAVDTGLVFAFQEISIALAFALYLANALIFGATVYLLGVRRRKTTWTEMGFPTTWNWNWLWIAIAIFAVSIILRLVIGMLAQLVFGTEELLDRMVILMAGGGFSWLNFGLTLLGVGLLAPTAEELFFRGLIHRWFIPRMAFWPRVLISSAIFGLGHFDSFTVMITAFVLGVINAVAYEKSKSLWLPILVHMLTNCFAVVLLYYLLALGFPFDQMPGI